MWTFNVLVQERNGNSQGGRLTYRAGVLLRVMIVKHLHGWSDPQAEEQLKKRMRSQRHDELEGDKSIFAASNSCRYHPISKNPYCRPF